MIFAQTVLLDSRTAQRAAKPTAGSAAVPAAGLFPVPAAKARAVLPLSK